MPFTANYNWETPDVGADFGSWGGIQNTTIEAIDTDLKAVSDTVTANALNVAKTNVNNTFSGVQAFAAVTATSVVSSGPVTASQYNGSGAGLTSNSVPLTSVASLVSVIGTIQSDIGVLDSRADATDVSIAGILSSIGTVQSDVGVLDSRADAVDLALPTKSNVGHTHTPAEILGAPVSGYGTQFTGNRTIVLDNVLSVGPAADFTTLIANVNAKLGATNDLLKALMTDLRARGVI